MVDYKKIAADHEAGLAEVKAGGPLRADAWSPEITEFYLQQSRKEGGGAYASAYATMQLVEIFRGNDTGDCDVITQLHRIAEAVEALKPET